METSTSEKELAKPKLSPLKILINLINSGKSDPGKRDVLKTQHELKNGW